MSEGTVGVVDYGMGNLLSVCHAVERAGGKFHICRTPEELENMERFILPGVGAFGDCMRNLKERGLIDALHGLVIGQKLPILGICLGMQVMARRGFEGGERLGLGWFEADVVRLTPDDPSLRVPQIGWNDVTFRMASELSNGLPERPDFYFVHSYCMRCDKPDEVLATCDYGGAVTAAVGRDNIIATQFHPEKSQDYGLRVIENFLSWRP